MSLRHAFITAAQKPQAVSADHSGYVDRAMTPAAALAESIAMEDSDYELQPPRDEAPGRDI